jgi:hypothetical protein
VQNMARAVVFKATVTAEANVQFLTVMATKMPCRPRLRLLRPLWESCA